MNCAHCGRYNYANSRICCICGRPIKAVSGDSHRVHPAMVGKTCPYCQTPLKPNTLVVICPKCGMPHHQDCWMDNGGCTTFGCDARITGNPVYTPGTLTVNLDPEVIFPIEEQMNIIKSPSATLYDLASKYMLHILCFAVIIGFIIFYLLGLR